MFLRSDFSFCSKNSCFFFFNLFVDDNLLLLCGVGVVIVGRL